MEVTRSNLDELMPEIERAISEAHFLAMDGEFTGLHSGSSIFPFESPARQYVKLRKGMDFLLVQFGLCAFQYDPQLNTYTHRAYNFYVFPRPLNRSAADPVFLCQSSSMNFLVSHGFDFNKLFKDGIPYMTQGEERLQQDRLREQERLLETPQRGDPVSVPVPDNLRDTVAHFCELVEDFVAGRGAGAGASQELELPRCNGFVRKLVHQEVQRLLPHGQVVLESRQVEGGARVLVALRAASVQEHRALQQQGLQRKRDQLDHALGFTKVLNIISRSGKLVVGHNMLLDVCHTLHQFVDALPQDYHQFKEMVNFVFPRLIDTKLMSASPAFKEMIGVNVLQNLYTSLCEEPFSMPVVEPAAEGVGYTVGQDKSHEAAYDAFLTGLCFISMANYVGSLESPAVQPVMPTSPLLEPYLNKLNLMRSVDSVYINLSGDDPEVSRSHVFYISFPKEWKTNDLSELFSPFGPIQIWWVSEVSAWVSLGRRDQARVVRTTLSQSDRYALVTHATYQLHEEQCGCSALSARNIMLCLKRFQTRSARSPIAVKRRVQETTWEDQASGAGTPKRRSHSFGECSFSKRSISTIVEEQDEDEEVKTAAGVVGLSSEPGDNGCVPNGQASAPDVPAKQFAECDKWD